MSSVCAGKSEDFQRRGSSDLGFLEEVDLKKKKKGKKSILGKNHLEPRQGPMKDASTSRDQ